MTGIYLRRATGRMVSLEPLELTLTSGVLVSMVLTLVLIPVLYYHAYRKTEEEEPAEVKGPEE